MSVSVPPIQPEVAVPPASVRFSAVIPAFNRERCIGAAIESVLRQTYPVHEVIVVDDGSTDGTPAVVAHAAQRDSRVRYLRQLNGGAAAARNRGIEVASGDWIAFLDSDDIWTPDKLANTARVIDAGPHIEFVHTNRTQVRPDGTTEAGRITEPTKLADKRYLMNGYNIKTTTVVVKTSLMNELGGLFATDMKTCEDYEFFWRAVAKAKAVAYIPSCDAIVHLTDDGLSRSGREVDLVRDNITAISRSAQWIAWQGGDPGLVEILRARLYWEYRALLALLLRLRRFRSVAGEWRRCRGEFSALEALKLVASAGLGAARDGSVPIR